MTDLPIHPIALIIVGWSLCQLKKQEITASSIFGECLTLVFWLSVYPATKWLLVTCFGGKIEVVSFGVYLKFMMMLMLGRVVEWIRCWLGKKHIS